MSLASYEPRVQCVDSKSGYPHFESCNTLLNKMDVSTRPTVFEDLNDPRVDVRTPYTINERKTPATGLSVIFLSTTDVKSTAQCTARIKLTRSVVALTSWSDIYVVLTAINAMCVRRRKSGFAVVIGEPLCYPSLD